jgi:hypothetical protein
MEPRGPVEPTDLRNLRIDALREAVAIYMNLAYEGAEPPEVVRRRLDWAPTADAEGLLNHPPFERSGKSKSTGSSIYALRLGNARYPHMKLQVQPWPNPAGFMLSVNTHDQVLSLDPNTADLPAFRELQGENQRVKEAIEQAWDDAGLPTFLRYLREYIQQRTVQDGGDPGRADPEVGPAGGS